MPLFLPQDIAAAGCAIAMHGLLVVVPGRRLVDARTIASSDPDYCIRFLQSGTEPALSLEPNGSGSHSSTSCRRQDLGKDGAIQGRLLTPSVWDGELGGVRSDGSHCHCRRSHFLRVSPFFFGVLYVK